MSYNSGKFISTALDVSVELEDVEHSSDGFICRMGKGYKIGLSIASVLGISLGIFIIKILNSTGVGVLFFAFGIIALLFLPTVFSYRCFVNKSSLKEVYLILFFKKVIEVKWCDIKYREVKKDERGNTVLIKLLNEKKEKMIAFDNAIVGFKEIVKMSRQKSILTLKNNKSK
ncbi:MAG: hypothetical protein IJZ93_03070 [Clostridia bacterium]|nr:hypothetical protein [Clostridia bacterium]